MKKVLLFSAVFVCALAQVVPAQITPTGNILYVKSGATGNNSGSSWANAVPELADALQWARDHMDEDLWDSGTPLQIWVAQGTYKPLHSAEDDPSGGPRMNSFVLIRDVQVYGGFKGDEASLSARTNWMAFPTVLSGDLDGNDGEEEFSDNAYHVVISAGEVGSALLDGFTITGGSAAGELDDYEVLGEYIYDVSGGGVYIESSYPLLRNLHIVENTSDREGAGIYLNGSSSDPRILKLQNVRLTSNQSNNGDGGGMYNYGVKLLLVNCVFMGNVAERGGAIFTLYAPSTYINTVLGGNKATEGASGYAGGIYIDSNFSSITFINCTMSANYGGAIYNFYDSPLTIRNSIIKSSFVIVRDPGSTGHVTRTNSIVSGFNTTEDGNIAGFTDPRFVNGRADATDEAHYPFTNGNFRLLTTSTAINKGSNTDYSAFGDLVNDKDAAGVARLAGGTIDMGAYEGGYGPLPVVLQEFKARKAEDAVVLSWQTTEESNVSHFEVQRSAGGADFMPVGLVQAAGESRKPEKYGLADRTAAFLVSAKDRIYYRLKTVDRDGTFSFSEIVVVEWKHGEGNGLAMLYPNPVRQHRVTLSALGGAYPVSARVFDITGREVKIASEPVAGGLSLSAEALPAGLYHVKVSDGQGSETTLRLVVE